MIRARGELLRFTTRDGLMLDGFLVPSRRHDTCVIHVHGMNSSFYRGDLQFAMASRLNKKGIASFVINTRGHDVMSSISQTPSRIKRRRTKRLILGTSLERFEDCVLDIDGAIRAMHRLGYKRFILSGHSTGCQKITYYQYKRNRSDVKGLILLSPGDDYNMHKKERGVRFSGIVDTCKRLLKAKEGKSTSGIPFGLSARRFMSVADLKNIEARLFNYDGPLKEIGSIRAPVLAVFGSRDEGATKPVKKCMEILERKRAGKPFSYAIIRGAGHSFRKHEDDLAGIVSGWMTRQLGKA